MDAIQLVRIQASFYLQCLLPQSGKMPPKKRKKLRLGVGAEASVLTRYLHPRPVVRAAIVNFPANDVTTELKVKSMGIRRSNGKDAVVVYLTSGLVDNGNTELYAFKRYVHVDKEGDPDRFFDDSPDDPPPPDDGIDASSGELLPLELAEAVRRAGNGETVSDEVARNFEAQGVLVDDDNQPVEENIPDPIVPPPDSIMKEWGNVNICARAAGPAGTKKEKAKMKGSKFDGRTAAELSLLSYFEAFIPKEFIEETIIPATNERLHHPLYYGEFLRWLGLWFLMATTEGNNRHDFWSSSNVDRFKGAPFRLNDLMSRDRFDQILGALAFNSTARPSYPDKFWEVRDLLESWNDNMANEFEPSWVSCLDESMSKWINQYTCPGFVFCPRKPWPFGNEYHTIACGESKILWRTEIVEGKDEPPQRAKKKYHDSGGRNKGTTVALMLRMTEPIHGTGKVIILDSGFCVLQGIICLLAAGLFAAALIKKRRYWPKFIQGDAVKAHFERRPVGDTDAWEGELDGHRFHVMCMKEPDYTMMLMSTYGTLKTCGELKRRNLDGGAVAEFRYPEVVANHYWYRDAVDSNNARRMGPIALEETWATTRWPCRVFAYLMATSAVNANLALGYFHNQPVLDELSARRQLAKELINNNYHDDVHPESIAARLRPRAVEHKLLRLEKGKKFDRSGRIVDAESDYPQASCSCPIGNKKKKRMFCACSPGIILCHECYSQHIADVQVAEHGTDCP